MAATFNWSCAHCGREAGKLEKAFEFKDKIVCGECHKRLSVATVPPSPQPSKAVPDPAPRQRTVTVCANCEQPIGKLEGPHTWGDQLVCADCHKKLSAPAKRRYSRKLRMAIVIAAVTAVLVGLALYDEMASRQAITKVNKNMAEDSYKAH